MTGSASPPSTAADKHMYLLYYIILYLFYIIFIFIIYIIFFKYFNIFKINLDIAKENRHLNWQYQVQLAGSKRFSLKKHNKYSIIEAVKFYKIIQYMYIV